jgi:hypothetical protein
MSNRDLVQTAFPYGYLVITGYKDYTVDDIRIENYRGLTVATVRVEVASFEGVDEKVVSHFFKWKNNEESAYVQGGFRRFQCFGFACYTGRRRQNNC